MTSRSLLLPRLSVEPETDPCTSDQDGAMSGTFESNHPYDLGSLSGFINREWCLAPPAGKSVKVSFGGFKSEFFFDGLAIKVDGQTHLFSGDDNVPEYGFSSTEREHGSTGFFFETRVGNESKLPARYLLEMTKKKPEIFKSLEDDSQIKVSLS